jgi:putative tricarboxylic transport membrane protein
MGRDPRELTAGASLLGIAALALWQGSDLEPGTLRQMGPGMLPRVLAVLVGLCGVAIGVRALRHTPPQAAGNGVTGAAAGDGATPGAEAARSVWGSLRAPLFLVLAATVFGLCVRPLGLVIASPLAIVISTWASPETKRLESLWFALGMTAFCVVLFWTLLKLPIPVAPWLIGY